MYCDLSKPCVNCRRRIARLQIVCLACCGRGLAERCLAFFAFKVLPRGISPSASVLWPSLYAPLDVSSSRAFAVAMNIFSMHALILFILCRLPSFSSSVCNFVQFIFIAQVISFIVVHIQDHRLSSSSTLSMTTVAISDFESFDGPNCVVICQRWVGESASVKRFCSIWRYLIWGLWIWGEWISEWWI